MICTVIGTSPMLITVASRLELVRACGKETVR
ncbi:hypothetical protein CEXT_36891, partial [Caerostris extrusa]